MPTPTLLIITSTNLCMSKHGETGNCFEGRGITDSWVVLDSKLTHGVSEEMFGEEK